MAGMDVSESTLACIWKMQLVDTQRLITDSGEAVRVIYPGRENRDRGPDFVGAIISTSSGEVCRGDIELHNKARDWRSHGHDRDPCYDGVILHVVWSGAAEAVLSCGGRVPTVSLQGCIRGSMDELYSRLKLLEVNGELCGNAAMWLSDKELGRLLDEAGESRFLLKADSFAYKLDHEPPEQVLYEGIMGALGYAKNREQFVELAHGIPLGVLEGMCRGKSYPGRFVTLKAMLLGKAGFLSERDEGELKRVWERFGDGRAMEIHRWHTFRVRPDNHPASRIEGAAHLLARSMEDGLLDGILRIITADDIDFKRLERCFIVSGTEACSGRKRVLIGEGRAREIVVNVILPFTLAWAQDKYRTKLVQKVWALYRNYPKAGEYGITRELATSLMGTGTSKLLSSVMRQQGLLHIERTFCRSRVCSRCPIARGTLEKQLAS
jgi:hypothetical protein